MFSNCAMFSSAFLSALSRKRVAYVREQLRTFKVSCLTWDPRWLRKESLLAGMILAMEMNTKSDKCCIVLTIARLMLWLKFMTYCNSSVSV